MIAVFTALTADLDPGPLLGVAVVIAPWVVAWLAL